MSDGDALLPLIVAGDALAFGRWVAGAEPSLRACLRRYAALVDTEAVLQEALLRVWQVAPRFHSDGRPDSLLRFAAVTVRNVAISQLRRSRPELAIDDEPVEPAVSSAAPDPLLRAAVIDSNQAGDDVIYLQPGTYTLTIAGAGEDASVTGDLDITDTNGTLTIRGAGEGVSFLRNRLRDQARMRADFGSYIGERLASALTRVKATPISNLPSAMKAASTPSLLWT